jgi:hypothetical protein
MLKLMVIAEANGFVSLTTEVTVLVQTVRQLPPAHSCPDGHAIGLPHCPQPLHVSTPPPAHWPVPGEQTGAAGHEQPPQAQFVPHACVPYVLHAWLEFGAHAP